MTPGFRKDPRQPGKVLVRQPGVMGDWQVCDSTPELENLVRQADMQASTGALDAKGDSATVADFRRESRDQSYAGYIAWTKAHGMSERHSINLQLQAFAGDMTAMTFAPGSTMGTTPTRRQGDVRDDPLERQGLPLAEEETDFDDDDDAYPKVADGDMDHVKMPSNASLRRLQRAGIISRRMSPEAFNARLARVGIEEPDRWRKAVQASMVQFFKANGDTWGPPAERPLTLAPGTVANLDAGTKQAFQQQLDQMRQELDPTIALVKEVLARQEARRRRELTGQA